MADWACSTSGVSCITVPGSIRSDGLAIPYSLGSILEISSSRSDARRCGCRSRATRLQLERGGITLTLRRQPSIHPKELLMTYAALPTRRIQSGTAITQASLPQAQSVSLDSPAASVMTDLSVTRAATVAALESIDFAERVMIQHGVRSLFVVSQSMAVEGMVTLQDLRDDRPLRKMLERNVARADVNVEDVMTPIGELDVVDIGAVAIATVGDVVDTLRAIGDPYLLVIERGAGGAARIRGLISRNQVERQLGESLGAFHTASSFAEVRAALS
jgi:CBS domain-containing protein